VGWSIGTGESVIARAICSLRGFDFSLEPGDGCPHLSLWGNGIADFRTPVGNSAQAQLVRQEILAAAPFTLGDVHNTV